MTIDNSQNKLLDLTQQAAQALLDKNWLLATAESCTGGWLAKCCTDLAGSSAWFERGFVTYSNQSKHDLLDVSLGTLEHYGAVSEQSAVEMASGALTRSQANISVAITGVAGPDGGSIEKPVGTVWIAWCLKNSRPQTVCLQLNGDREQIRYQAVVTALKGIIKNARD